MTGREIFGHPRGDQRQHSRGQVFDPNPGQCFADAPRDFGPQHRLASCTAVRIVSRSAWVNARPSTKIAVQIVDQGGDYVLGLKGNQSTLHEEFKELFTAATAGGFASVHDDYTEETDKDHGRLEVRRYRISEELGTLSDTER